ncbi:50S ribosomal protein L20 [Alkaliphilus hydrothermalis]|uniref:Large ribosomal subunit protein bL20 n=1 Tax=Alkaliphilus hydrothermalis TaxID=1482730 RepID=A0ABS2NSS7_9FIRM|nr:50S ribosomal protein L20 [Alkaliphilus hydrothermalis]MBM7615927.1 large subunit ribosomal protein L20 [Alkaliphilus hydrothermalis]
MARVKGAVNARKKHKKILKLAKGFRGARSKLFRPANQFVMKALKHAYVGRKLKKREYRKLWISRINAATRANGLSYSRFMNGLKLSGIQMNRKVLAEMAIHDKEGFAKLVEAAKQKLNS